MTRKYMPHNVDLSKLNLALPNISFKHQGKDYIFPLTDHPPIIQNTVCGTIGTLNILNPGSRIAPPAVQDNIDKLPPETDKARMEQMAEYIHGLFKAGIGLLALQELPQPKTAEFNYLYKKLEELNKKEQVIDLTQLARQWKQTKPHNFGTSILCNPTIFKVTKNATSVLDDRGAQYEVTSASGDIVPVANIHGDFSSQANTAQYVSAFKGGYCLGDLNISNSPAQTTTPSLDTFNQPILQIQGKDVKLNTYDAIVDTYSVAKQPGYTPDRNIIISPPKITQTITTSVIPQTLHFKSELYRHIPQTPGAPVAPKEKEDNIEQSLIKTITKNCSGLTPGVAKATTKENALSSFLNSFLKTGDPYPCFRVGKTHGFSCLLCEINKKHLEVSVQQNNTISIRQVDRSQTPVKWFPPMQGEEKTIMLRKVAGLIKDKISETLEKEKTVNYPKAC